MNRKLNIYLLFAAIVTIFILYFVFTSGNYGAGNAKNSNSNKIGIETFDYQNLADTISKYIDTSFYAEYRVKPNKYLFNYINLDNVSDPFALNDTLENLVFNKAKQIPINRIWQYNSENFMRFEVFSHNKKSLLIVLHKSQDSIKSREFEPVKISDFHGVNKEKSLGNDASIKQISTRVYLLSDAK